MTRKYDPALADRWRRRSMRLETHNYGWSGTYHITLNATEKHELDGALFDIPELRAILQRTWEALPQRFVGLILDEFVIMPDHIHCILHLEGNVEKPATLAQVVGTYKSIVSVEWLRYLEETNANYPGRIWQRSFYDCIIRDASQLEKTRNYIRNNPIKEVGKK